MAEWTSKSVEEIFTKEQLRKINAFVKAHKNDSPYNLTGELKELMKPWSKELEEKGVLSDFMAYAFANMWAQAGTEKILMVVKMARKRLGEVGV